MSLSCGLVFFQYHSCVLGHFFCLCPGDNHDAVAVGDNYVARLNKDVAADNGTVHRFYFVSARPDSPADFFEIQRNFLG